MNQSQQSVSTAVIHTDIVLFGGGIAGLYLLKLLSNLGYDCILIEKNQLGGGQTLQAQGIIHGGMKYALGGHLNSEFDAIKAMPNRWRSMLSGNETVNLTDTQVVSETQHMWSSGKFASRFTSFFASKLLRGQVDKLNKSQMPPLFQTSAFTGNVYKLTDLVLDTPSLLKNLAQGVEQRILRADTLEFDQQNDRVESVTLRFENSEQLQVYSKAMVFCAGEGNETLCQQAGVENAPMQRRPLHMVMVKHDLPFSLYAHGIGNAKPRITITTHETRDGKKVWYLGGELSESGVERNKEAQIAAAKIELSELFPWLDFGAAEWATFFIDRAEPLQQSMNKPDCAYTHQEKNLLVAWPTKLTLAPDLGDRIVEHLNQLAVTPSDYQHDLSVYPHAEFAEPQWETLF